MAGGEILGEEGGASDTVAFCREMRGILDFGGRQNLGWLSLVCLVMSSSPRPLLSSFLPSFPFAKLVAFSAFWYKLNYGPAQGSPAFVALALYFLVLTQDSLTGTGQVQFPPFVNF